LVSNGGFIAYYRVSTGKQGKSGLGIEAQRHAVANYLNGGNWRIIEEFTEVESGKRSDRSYACGYRLYRPPDRWPPGNLAHS
jgi:hypothetical protein